MSDAVQSSVKNVELIKKRREEIISSAITLFKDKGFHRTTTREIAAEAGFSIGTLYEYVRTKEDVLFLVYEAINDLVYDHLEAVLDLENPTLTNLYAGLDSYYRLMDRMQDEVVILYQEVKSLDPHLKDRILEKEREMVAMLKQVLMACLADSLAEQKAEILANNVFVQGQMWSFRRWILKKQFTLDEYIDYQLTFLKNALNS